MYLPEYLLGKVFLLYTWMGYPERYPDGCTYLHSHYYEEWQNIQDSSHHVDIPAGKEYLDVARNIESDTPPDHSIVRNHHYHYEISKQKKDTPSPLPMFPGRSFTPRCLKSALSMTFDFCWGKETRTLHLMSLLPTTSIRR